MSPLAAFGASPAHSRSCVEGLLQCCACTPEVLFEGCTDSGKWVQIEPRYVNLTETCFVAPPEKIAAACDKNTIGVVGILGTTYSGHYEDIAGIDRVVGTSLSELCSLRWKYTVFSMRMGASRHRGKVLRLALEALTKLLEQMKSTVFSLHMGVSRHWQGIVPCAGGSVLHTWRQAHCED